MSVVFSQFSRNSAGTGRRIHWRFEEITTHKWTWLLDCLLFFSSFSNKCLDTETHPPRDCGWRWRSSSNASHTHTHGVTHAAESKTRSRQVQVGRTDWAAAAASETHKNSREEREKKRPKNKQKKRKEPHPPLVFFLYYTDDDETPPTPSIQGPLRQQQHTARAPLLLLTGNLLMWNTFSILSWASSSHSVRFEFDLVKKCRRHTLFGFVSFVREQLRPKGVIRTHTHTVVVTTSVVLLSPRLEQKEKKNTRDRKWQSERSGLWFAERRMSEHVDSFVSHAHTHSAGGGGGGGIPVAVVVVAVVVV